MVNRCTKWTCLPDCQFWKVTIQTCGKCAGIKFQMLFNNLTSTLFVTQWCPTLTSSLCLFSVDWKQILSQLSFHIKSHFCTPSALPLQYQAWWSDRYGKSSLSDDEEVETLLTQKSNSSRNALTTSVTPALDTRSTWKNVLCWSRLFWTQAVEDFGLLLGSFKPLRADQLFANTSAFIMNPAEKSYSGKNVFKVSMIHWVPCSHVIGGGFMSLCSLPHHVPASNCQNNMQGQSSMTPRKHVHTVHSVNTLAVCTPQSVMLCCVYLLYEYNFL